MNQLPDMIKDDLLPVMVKDYLREMSQRGDEKAWRLFHLYGGDEFLRFTLTQDQAEAIAQKLNQHLLPVYEIPIGRGFTIPSVVNFLPESADMELQTDEWFSILLPRSMTKDGEYHSITVGMDDVTVEWVQHD